MLGNHRYLFIIRSHVYRNSCFLAFELICTQFKDCPWKLRGTVPWEQRGRERFRRMGSGSREERQRRFSPASYRQERVWKAAEAPGGSQVPGSRTMLGKGRGKAGHERGGAKMDGFSEL